MKLFFMVWGALFSIGLLSAQTLGGRVMNHENQPVAFANIVLLDTDSAFIEGGISDGEGLFSLPLSAKATWLKITYIGYQDRIVPVSATRWDMGDVRLEEDTQLLHEIVVKGNLPKTRIKGDAMVTTVAGSLLEKAGTAIDLLQKVPGLLLKGEDVHVFGRGAPQVYINGRQVRDLSELTQLSSENIQSVEVVANPGVRYDKTVKAVIRIRTKKTAGDGFGFADRANLSYNDKWSYLNQLDVHYRRGRLDLTGLLAYANPLSWRRTEAVQRTYLDPCWLQQMNAAQAFASKRWTGTLTMNYMLSPTHALGGSYRYRRYPKSTNEMSLETDIIRNDLFFEKAEGQIGSESAETRHEADLYYTGRVGKATIDVNGTWLHTAEDVGTLTVENRHNGEVESDLTSVHTDADTRNRFYAGKVIASYPLPKGTFSIGGEYTHTLRTSVYKNEEGIVADDDSRMKENLWAAFVECEHAFGRVKLQAGVRLENVRFDYYQRDILQEEQSKTYHNWFPSLSASLPLGGAEMQLSYTSDISRPAYEMLRSRVDYVNRYTYESGNPFLLPALTHTLAFKTVYKWGQLYVDWQRRKDAFIPYSRAYSSDDPTLALLSTENAPAYQVVDLMLLAAPTLGCWSPQFSFEVYKQWYEVEKPGASTGMLSLGHASLALRWMNGFRLPWGVAGNADMQWEGPADRDNISYKAVWWMNASLQKEFFHARLSVLVQANDIFNTYRNSYFMYYGRLRTMSLYEKYSRRSLSLTLRYTFNSRKSKYKGTGAGGDQKYRL